MILIVHVHLYKITNRRKLIILLLQDLEALVHIPKIRALGESGGGDKAYLALSDIHRLLIARGEPSLRAKSRLAAQKVLFYAANLDHFDRERLEVEVGRRRRSMEAEEQQTSQLDKDLHDRKNLAQERTALQKRASIERPKIEEIAE